MIWPGWSAYSASNTQTVNASIHFPLPVSASHVELRARVGVLVRLPSGGRTCLLINSLPVPALITGASGAIYAVPEPSTGALLLISILCVLLMRRR
jgi:hypothetical protein